MSLVGDRQAKTDVDSRLVGKRKCCLFEAVVGRSDGQQQYYLKLLKLLVIARLRVRAFKYNVINNYELCRSNYS